MSNENKTNSNSNEDLIYIKEECSLHHYRTEIPNIIFELNWKPQKIAVYCVLKRCAGDNGKCFKSKKNICKQAHISKTTFVKLKKELSKIDPILKKPLIIFKSRMSDVGDQDSDEITITNIWPENFNYFSKGGGSNQTPPGSNETPGVGQMRDGGGSNEGHEEEPIKKNPYKKNNSFVEGSNELRLATLLFSSICKFKEDFKSPNLNQWATHIDLMIRIDKRDPKMIEKIILWLPSDEFWRKNILSTQKLREKFDRLSLETPKKSKEFRKENEAPKFKSRNVIG